MKKKIIAILVMITTIIISFATTYNLKTKALYDGFPTINYDDYQYVCFVSYVEEDNNDLLVDLEVIFYIDNVTNELIADNDSFGGYRLINGDPQEMQIDKTYLVKLDQQGYIIEKYYEYNSYLNYQINQETYDYYNSGVTTGSSMTNSQSYSKGYDDGREVVQEYYQQEVLPSLREYYNEEKEEYGQEQYQQGIQYAQSLQIDQPDFYNMLKQVALYPVLIFTNGLDINIFGINIGGLLLGIFMIATILIIVKFVMGIFR